MKSPWIKRAARGAPSVMALGAAALTLAALLLALASRAGAQQGSTPDRAAITERSRVTVNSLYDKWADVLRRSGTEVTVRLTNFRTVFSEEFATTALRDVVTVVPEKRFLVDKSIVADQEQRVLGVSYEPEWRPVTDDQVEPEVRTWNPTIREVQEQEKAADSTRSNDFKAATTFEVALEAMGQSISYKALLLWPRLFSGQDPGAYHLNDPVAQMIEEAARETHHVAPLEKLQLEMHDHLKTEAERLEYEQGIQDDPSCLVDTQDYDYPQTTAHDDYEHSTGYHTSSAIFGFTCSCNARCTSTSEPQFRYRACLDNGSLYRGLRFHATHGTHNFTSGLIVDGHLRGAPAAGTAACFVESCSYVGGCDGGSIQFSPGQGGRLQANFTGQQIWDGQLDYVGECGRCTALQPDRTPRGRDGRGPFNPSEEPPNGTGGGWTGGGCWMTCSPATYNDVATCSPYPTPCTFETCEVTCPL